MPSNISYKNFYFLSLKCIDNLLVLINCIEILCEIILLMDKIYPPTKEIKGENKFLLIILYDTYK